MGEKCVCSGARAWTGGLLCDCQLGPSCWANDKGKQSGGLPGAPWAQHSLSVFQFGT